tara:strand:- start:266 stop:562 length:297 start_codon:yes stop_codon:yes gene_type:complete
MVRNSTPPSPLELFDKAIQTITQERGKDYGPPGPSFRHIMKMQRLVMVCPDPAVRHALNMIIVKIVRLAQTPDHMDSVIDIAGYARTIAMVLDEEEKQ